VEVICLLMKWTWTPDVFIFFFYKRKNPKNYGLNKPYIIWYKLLLNYPYFKEVSIQVMILWNHLDL
jgi:hypothetical protein